MRALDPILQAAMDSGIFEPIIELKDPAGNLYDCIYYKLHNLELDVIFYGSIPASGVFQIERGALINGTRYTIETIYYNINEIFSEKGFYHCKCHAFFPLYTSTLADVTYENIIDTLVALGTETTLTAVFMDEAAAWLDYQFLPDGKNYTTNNLHSFLNFLAKKYLIYATDNDENNILFFSIKDVFAKALEHTITYEYTGRHSYKSQNRQYIWRTETNSLGQAGDTEAPIHNLGYLETTATHPNIFSNGNINTIKTIAPIHLKYQTGDRVVFVDQDGTTSDYKSALDVTEIFDRKKTPAWYQELRPIEFFANTEGGALPSTIERVAAYTPLVTTGFDNNLDSSVNNLQALAEAVDELPLGTVAPTTTATNDFQVGDGAGAWIKKTLAQTITILQTSLDSIYAAISHVHDASIITYAPADNTDWNSSTDPGDVDNALDQLANRTKTLEGSDSSTILGFQPYAYPLGFSTDASTGNATLAANGGSHAAPILITAPMLLESVTIKNANTSLAREWRWDLYLQDTNTGDSAENTVNRVATCSGNDNFTPSAASLRTLSASSNTLLQPGLYWIVIQCTHASNSFLYLAQLGNSTFAVNHYQTKTTSNPNGSTLDLIAATWTKSTAVGAIRLNGIVLGQSTAW